MDRLDEEVKESEQKLQKDLENDIRYELNHFIEEHMFDGGGVKRLPNICRI